MQNPDWRHIENGNVIPTLGGYSDQPYLVKAHDGAWVCATTTGHGVEGEPGECVVVSRSTDFGVTWSDPVMLDDEKDHAYAVLSVIPSGRIFCFYNHNTDDLKKEELFGKRCDMGGHFVFKYSDDHGMSWSAVRYEIPVREFIVDRMNTVFARGVPYRFFWNVGRPFTQNEDFFLPLIKFNFHKESIIDHSEGVLLKSSNLMIESSPENILWETLPDGECGLSSPVGGGKVSEEHSFVPLSDGSIFCVYRTTDGRPAFSYSRDNAHTWDEPQYLHLKNPRAANFIWKCRNGKYLYWFHNNGMTGYTDRNPVWVSCAHEEDSPDGKTLSFGEPEILFYDDSEYTLISYPDMIEDNDRIFISETQKDIARIHEIPSSFINRLMGNDPASSFSSKNIIFDAGPGCTSLPHIPPFSAKSTTCTHFSKIDLRTGLTFEIIFSGNGTLFDNRDDTGKGISIESENGFIYITMCDGRTMNSWNSSPFAINDNGLNHLGVVIDGGPKIIYLVLNGVFCDGGDEKPFGWCRFASQMLDINGRKDISLSENIKLLRIHDRALMTCELTRGFLESRSIK